MIQGWITERDVVQRESNLDEKQLKKKKTWDKFFIKFTVHIHEKDEWLIK